MKISFIEWFASLIFKDMKDYRINEKEKNRLYTQIRKIENIQEREEEKIL